MPNENDSSKDYILSRYSVGFDAIEVVTISEASNLDDLINLLKNGIECQLHSRRVIFTICTSTGQYTGVLCKTKELKMLNGLTVFSKIALKYICTNSLGMISYVWKMVFLSMEMPLLAFWANYII